MANVRTIRSSAALLAATFLVGACSASACPNCGIDAVREQQGGSAAATGYTMSIVGLGSAPLFVGGAMLLAVRRLRREQAEDERCSDDARDDIST